MKHYAIFIINNGMKFSKSYPLWSEKEYYSTYEKAEIEIKSMAKSLKQANRICTILPIYKS